MKRLLFLPLFIAITLNAAAQRNRPAEEPVEAQESSKGKKERAAPSDLPQSSDKKYLDLLMYYMDGEYEKCLKKCQKITEDEETAKDAIPYLYASMSLHEMSFLEQYQKDYPDALKESLKYAAKYRKKDEKNSQKQGLPYLEYWEENISYFNKLRKTAKDAAQKQLDENKVSKAEQYYKAIVAFDPSDYSTYYMMGTLRLEAGDTANARKMMEQFDKEVTKMESFSSEPDDKQKLLKYAHFEYAKFLITANRSDAAKLVIEHLKGYTGKDEEIDQFIEEKKL